MTLIPLQRYGPIADVARFSVRARMHMYQCLARILNGILNEVLSRNRQHRRRQQREKQTDREHIAKYTHMMAARVQEGRQADMCSTEACVPVPCL